MTRRNYLLLIVTDCSEKLQISTIFNSS